MLYTSSRLIHLLHSLFVSSFDRRHHSFSTTMGVERRLRPSSSSCFVRRAILTWMTLFYRLAHLTPTRGFRSLSLSRFLTSCAFPTGSSSASSTPTPHTSHSCQRTYSKSALAAHSFNQSSFALLDEDEEMTSFSTTFPDEIIETDTYNGISLRLDHVADNQDALVPDIVQADSFRTRLQESLKRWREEGRVGIWIYVPTANADLVPIATQFGFQFHMVNKEGQLILSHWLPKDVPSRLPRGPMYQVGVGCIVLKPDDPTQMLVVQELTGPAAASKSAEWRRGWFRPFLSCLDLVIVVVATCISHL